MQRSIAFYLFVFVEIFQFCHFFHSPPIMQQLSDSLLSPGYSDLIKVYIEMEKPRFKKSEMHGDLPVKNGTVAST